MGDGDGITEWLRRARDGDRGALDRVFERIYGDLRRIAHAQLRSARRGDTLRTTALVNEAYLKLVGSERLEVADRGHVLSLAARAMRQILVDYARERRAAKRGGDAQRAALDSAELAVDAVGGELLAVEGALVRLEALDARLARIVELRFFGGFTEAEIAELLEVHERTVRRDWRKARAFLFAALESEASP